MFPLDTKILVIDDFSTMRKIIKKTLGELGYSRIEEADDGATAWPLIEAAHQSGQPFGFIISDWNMPGMTGLDLLKNVRAGQDDLKKTPFLMVTAEAEQSNVVVAVKAGVSNYIIKPFSPETLKEKIGHRF